MPRTPEIHVSSLVIQHNPDRTESLREAAAAIAGLDWCAAENGKAVVTLVTGSAHEVLDHIATLNAVPGVHTTTMVFHHYEPADAVEAPAG
ncbi:chaperone NapD [Azospirillum doebereinerae]|uniref:Chaperone NapD n=1 Tax=Azospirillum doebereinerae TaxID=92933 RepID=A0A433JFF8_9PROT|nr:chaperone NapD [Azospirillum doebereinerae]MCG5240179.1 chaperone NapD [Azospirillum doebereinerae]RUQ75912.1 nitrate reductase [Azospirillum doebereinerae]